MIGTTTLRQFGLLLREKVTLRDILLNRFFVLTVIVLILAGSTAIYVDANSNGTIEGVVIDENGEPVEGAEVTLTRIEVATTLERYTTTSEEDGTFVFEEKTEVLELQIEVERDGENGEVHKHLWFRGQDTSVTVVVS